MENEFKKYNLDSSIIRALEELNYNKETKVQKMVIREALQNKDLVVKSETGTGKTASFVVPMVQEISWEENEPQALILAPTRELAIQIGEDVKNIGRFKRINGVTLFGKMPYKEQELNLKGKVHVIIGTPGRVLDHIERGTLNIKNIKYLVIDEGDVMLNMGFISQVESIVKRLNKKRNTMLFSATICEEIKELSSKIMNDQVFIEVKNNEMEKGKIDHYLYYVKNEYKMEFLRKLLIKENPQSTVIFCKTKDNVDTTYQFLKKHNYSVSKIHGGLLQKDRSLFMEQFKEGKFKLLVATDVCSRGIDVEEVTHIINFDIPLEKESYVHRTGRTGRKGGYGKAFTFLTTYEEKYLKEIEEYIGFNIERLDVKSIQMSNDEIIEGEENLKKPPIKKNINQKKVTEGITKLYFNGGKKKKIRAIDFVGTISRIEGVSSEDIGIIEIKDNGSYVEILNNKGNKVLNTIKEMTIKNKKLKVEKANKR